MVLVDVVLLIDNLSNFYIKYLHFQLKLYLSMCTNVVIGMSLLDNPNLADAQIFLGPRAAFSDFNFQDSGGFNGPRPQT